MWQNISEIFERCKTTVFSSVSTNRKNLPYRVETGQSINQFAVFLDRIASVVYFLKGRHATLHPLYVVTVDNSGCKTSLLASNRDCHPA